MTNRQRRVGLVAVAVLAFVAVIVAVSLYAGVPRWRIASEASPDGYYLALHVGVLKAAVNLDGSACLWFDEGTGRDAIFWPYGYQAGGWPVAVFDASGRLLARAGDRVQIGGGNIPPKPIVGCTGFQRIWAAAPRPVPI